MNFFLKYDAFRWGWAGLLVLTVSALLWAFAFHAIWRKERDRTSCILGALWMLASLRACVNLFYAFGCGCGLTGQALVFFSVWNFSLAAIVPIVECGALTIVALLWSVARERGVPLSMPTNMAGVVAGLLSVVLWWFTAIFGLVFGLAYH